MRLLAGHPHLVLAGAVSSSHAGQHIAHVHRHLNGFVRGEFLSPEQGLERLADAGDAVVFSCLGARDSAAALREICTRDREKRLRVIDLSGDFRLPAALYQGTYGAPHPAPDLVPDFVYGLPELAREEIARARRIANPGCFATAITLALAPVWQEDLIAGDVCVSAVTGSSGSGAKPSEGTHHPLRHANLWAYRPLAHQHQPEIERALGKLREGPLELSFVPHSGPFVRGIHATVQLRLRAPMSESALTAKLAAFYAEAPFTQVVTGCPRLSDVVGSNLCVIGCATHGDRAAIFSVIDNLVKGAAGQALQNANLALDLAETAGLDLAPMGVN
jgi:N-acetyl-gamma-glutamyl-phosphate reductase